MDATNATRFVPRDEVEQWAEELPEEFIQCRDFGHTWRPYTARWVPEHYVYERSLRCARCGTTRDQTLSPSGEILTGGYGYPRGYQMPPGAGRIDASGRSALRLTSTLRLIGD